MLDWPIQITLSGFNGFQVLVKEFTLTFPDNVKSSLVEIERYVHQFFIEDHPQLREKKLVITHLPPKKVQHLSRWEALEKCHPNPEKGAVSL